MGSLKAPRPDGFQPLFFKKTESKIGPSLANFALGALNGEEISDKSDGALLVLIPKQEKPDSGRNFRPISLCNTCTKLVTKVIANRLKGILKDIISPSQASFIPGRQAIKNVVICQEVIHSLGYTRGRRGRMVVMIDLEKAYDHVE